MVASATLRGSVTISFLVSTPIDDITNDVQRVNLIVNLNRELYNTNDYEASMTNGKAYDLFTTTNVNLTTNGSLSAYYSLFVQGNESIYKDGYHRSLISTYVFPVNTKLTLVNLNEDSVNEYYYYVVTEEDYKQKLEEFDKNKEASYNFSDFIRMGSTSTNNKFDDNLSKISNYAEQINQVLSSNNGNKKSIQEIKDIICVILGIDKFINNLNSDEKNIFENIINKSKDVLKIHFIFIDSSNNLKKFEYESWYKETVDPSKGLWIGDGFAEQYSIKPTKLIQEYYETFGAKYGYLVNNGFVEFIKLLDKE